MDRHFKTMKPDHLLCTRVNSTLTKDLNHDTIQILAGNIAVQPPTFLTWIVFFSALSPRARETKGENKQMGLPQAEELLHSRGNHPSMRRRPTAGRKYSPATPLSAFWMASSGAQTPVRFGWTLSHAGKARASRREEVLPPASSSSPPRPHREALGVPLARRHGSCLLRQLFSRR